MVVSPTRAYVAFIEFNRVYLAELPVSASSDAVPTAAPNVLGTKPSLGSLEPRLIGIYGTCQRPPPPAPLASRSRESAAHTASLTRAPEGLAPTSERVAGGDFLTWSADGSVLSWVHGAMHYSIVLELALPACA